jgi:hypothetical protein
MAEAKKVAANSKTIYIAGLISWLVPGSGYWLLGQRNRGVIIFITILGTFLLGMLLGGAEMVDPKRSMLWFVAQILTGAPGLLAALIQNPNIDAGYGKGIDFGQVYSGVAGLLNLICVLDVLIRCQNAITPQTQPKDS